MNIAVDIGNTCIKCAFAFPREKVVQYRVWTIPPKRDQLDSFVLQCLLRWGAEPGEGKLMPDAYTAPITWLIVQTGKLSWQELKAEILKIRRKDKFTVVTRKHIPLEVDVDFPDKVGIDRLLAAYSAVDLYGSAPMLIVDAGTAITVDRVYNQTFQGGAIVPGLIPLSKMCPLISEKLPLIPIADYSVTKKKLPVFPGRNTADAIENGIYWGTIGKIMQFYAMSYSREDAFLILTGGDAEYLLPGIASMIRPPYLKYHDPLVLEGILRCFE